MNEYFIKRLEDSVKTMESFCANARRDLKFLETDSPEEKANAVIHAPSWGLANASTGIISALAYLGRERQKKDEA